MTNTQLLQALYDDMQTVKKHVVSLDNRVSSLEVKMDSLDNRVSSLEVKMDSLDKKVDSLSNRVSSLEVKVDSLDKEVHSLWTTGFLPLKMKYPKSMSHLRTKQTATSKS